ncbi:MAG TPA: hypothetical protein VIJ38_03930 [Acidobacteriaceae bacterium]
MRYRNSHVEYFQEEQFAVYQYVPRPQIIEVLTHLRDLFRQLELTSEREQLAAERRDVVAKYLISNLRRTGDHPTLHTLMEIAETFLLTIGGAHELFGYDLEAIRQFDLRCNASRTHIIEAYTFERDRLVDLPLEMAPAAAFEFDAMLGDLVRLWEPPLPIQALDARRWHRPGMFYVHVGTEDSQGTSLPPGSMALVEPIDQAEAQRPNPRLIYLLQFGNGYRCSRCVVTRGKLQLLATTRIYTRAQEFAYPGEVRVAGRIRMFAHALPQPEHKIHGSLPLRRFGAALILPWEHRTRDHLLMTKHRRFQRSKEEEAAIRELLENLLQSPLSGRTERRYRSPGSSEPHVSALIQLTLAHFARYSDSLRGSGPPISDRGRYSLETMLNARRFSELLAHADEAPLPTPSAVWKAMGPEFVDWASLLSLKFPTLHLRNAPVVRLAHPCDIQGLEPAIAAGSWMLLEPIVAPPEIENERNKRGWSRPFYVLRRGMNILSGYLEREGAGYVLLSNPHGLPTKLTVGADEVAALNRVAGVAVPV